MGSLCGLVGEARCLTVRYEDLVTNTENILRQVSSWLDLAWDPVMLRHHEVMDQVETSVMETTADQVRVETSHWSRSLHILSSHWWSLTMLVPRSMP